MSRRMIVATAFAALLAAPLLAASAQAETVTFHAKLDGAHEVPANKTKGSGMATVVLDTATHKITYTVSFSGLTGPATAGHIHGPAAPGKNAGVLVPFAKAPTSPIKGSATLTSAQQADMMKGMTYVNIHTAMHKGGEIRGQLTK